MPTLTELVRSALQFMKMHHGERGYYLFVEGGLIDIAHHANYGAHALSDTLAFDEAIQVKLLKLILYIKIFLNLKISSLIDYISLKMFTNIS